MNNINVNTKTDINYRGLFDNHPQPMWIYDFESLKFIAVNNAAIKTYGYSRDEFYQMTIKDIRPKDEIDKLLEVVDNRIDKFQKSGRWKHKKKNGELFDVEIISHELEFEGRIARFVLVNDITANIKMLNALKASEQKHREFFETVAVGMAEVDINGVFLRVNKKLCEILGYSQEELVGHTFNEFSFFDDKDIGYEYFKKIIDKKAESYTFEKRYISKNKKIIYAKLTTSQLLQLPNLPARFLTVVVDITKSKLDEIKLERESKIKNSIVESAIDCIISINSKGKIVEWNPASEKTFGYTKSEVLGKNLEDIIFPVEYAEEYKIGLAKFLKTGIGPVIGRNIEYPAINKNGDKFPVELSVVSTNLKDEHYFISYLRDISERKAAQYHENYLAAIVQSSEDAIIGMDLDLIITSWNHGAEKMFGYSEEEAIGNKTDLIHLPGIYDFDFFDTEKLKKGIRIGHYETVRRHKDGHFIDVSISISPVRNYDGTLMGYSKILRDITRQKKASLEISELLQKEKEARIEAETNHKRLSFLTKAGVILNSSLNYKRTLASLVKLSVPDLADWCAVDIIDKSGILRRIAVEHYDPMKVELVFKIFEKYPTPYANRGAYKVIKTKKTEVYEDITEEMIREVTINDEHYKLIKGLGARSAILTPLLTRNKILGVITFFKNTVLNKDSLLNKELAESLARRAALAVDNSNLYEETQTLNIELEQRVELRTAQLKEANKELEAFSYSVSHDLRSPLRAIDGFSGFLLEDYSDKLDDEGKRYLNVIKNNSVKMGQLIDDLLAFSRMNRSTINYTNLQMKNLANMIFEELSQFEKDRKIEFKIEELPDIPGDYSLIKQVWQNLISNAIKFTGNKKISRIHIGFNETKENVTYFVKDNGVGFDMNYVSKLFDVFQRLHKSTEFPGTGVGLALVKRIILRHNGSVKAEGELNKGAKIYFSLPKEVNIKNE